MLSFCRFRRIAVVINARPTKLSTEVEALKYLPLTLHPVQVCKVAEFVADLGLNIWVG
jgi:hypothetical protein